MTAPITTSAPTASADEVSIEEVKENYERMQTLTNEDVEDLVREEFADAPVMVRVARCESQFHQWDSDGETLKSRLGTADYGVFQINKVHHERMKELGLDYNDVHDNIEYARLLYEESGGSASPHWNASRDCWNLTEV